MAAKYPDSITQNICWTIINTIHLRDNKFVMVVKSKAPGDSKFYDNLAQAAIQLTSIISKESRNAPTCFRAKKTREKQQPDGLQGHHFQVSFNLKIILYVAKITQNTVTELLKFETFFAKLRPQTKSIIASEITILSNEQNIIVSLESGRHVVSIQNGNL